MSSKKNGGAGTPSAMTYEPYGIEIIPQKERTYKATHIFRVMLGANLTYSTIIFGSFPILFGLSWWASFFSVIVGCFIGGIYLAPTSLFGPKTGTNNAVSSGAHFGIAGRFIGTFLALFSALGFTAITIWTSGQALASGAARLFSGVTDNATTQAISYLLIWVVVVWATVRGIHLVIKLQERVMVPVMGVVLALGVIAFWPMFDSGYKGGELFLGSFTATWLASTLIIASVIVSYGPFVGDWSRYIDTSSNPPRRLLWWTFLGGFVGLTVPFMWGAYVTSTFAADAGTFIAGLIKTSPTWYVLGLIIVGLVAGIAQGTIGLYGTGLDTSSLIPRLSRQQSTLLIGFVSIFLVFMGAFVWDAIAATNAFLVILLVVTAPWIVILAIGYFARGGNYLPDDLQVFNRHQRGGRYWFNAGWNLRAVGAWIPSSVIGLLMAYAAPLWIGPWSNIAGGIDISFVVSSVVAGVLYALFLVIFPEPDYVFDSKGPRFGGKKTGTKPEAITKR